MSGCSPLLGDLLNSKRKAYEQHLTEVKIKRTAITCCLCRAQSHLDTDHRRSLKSVICVCTHPLCACCPVCSDVFTQLKGFRHHIAASDRFLYSYGFYCDGCGASNKVTPLLQPRATPPSTPDSSHRLRPRPPTKEWTVDFTWRRCRWCEQRCHEKCLMYRIQPWEHVSEASRSPKRSRKDYDNHSSDIKARIATGHPTSPLALYTTASDDYDSDDSTCSSTHTTSRSLTAEEIETLEYAM
ncbi:Surface antigen-like protein [Lasiodiplodia theobromae]|uniref:Surface antigen-like protein n=1 Tax=Lasiodiplodia theobromae TaxID=45133 RepID=UPI0015C3352C|nr:Surface antigen-like protein [Lasiodiplodia theobromae]KAF4536685.1 Surface antigen-like protein [Lasiodiplodia theobromae]